MHTRPNAQGKRRRSTEGAEGTNKGHENAEGMALVGVRLTAQLGFGAEYKALKAKYAGPGSMSSTFSS